MRPILMTGWPPPYLRASSGDLETERPRRRRGFVSAEAPHRGRLGLVSAEDPRRRRGFVSTEDPRRGRGAAAMHQRTIRAARARADERHLEDDAERVADVVHGKLVEGLRAVAAEDDEAVALARAAELAHERPDLRGNQALVSPDSKFFAERFRSTPAPRCAQRNCTSEADGLPPRSGPRPRRRAARTRPAPPPPRGARPRRRPESASPRSRASFRGSRARRRASGGRASRRRACGPASSSRGDADGRGDADRSRRRRRSRRPIGPGDGDGRGGRSAGLGARGGARGPRERAAESPATRRRRTVRLAQRASRGVRAPAAASPRAPTRAARRAGQASLRFPRRRAAASPRPRTRLGDGSFRYSRNRSATVAHCGRGAALWRRERREQKKSCKALAALVRAPWRCGRGPVALCAASGFKARFRQAMLPPGLSAPLCFFFRATHPSHVVAAAALARREIPWLREQNPASSRVRPCRARILPRRPS